MPASQAERLAFGCRGKGVPRLAGDTSAESASSSLETDRLSENEMKSD